MYARCRDHAPRRKCSNYSIGGPAPDLWTLPKGKPVPAARNIMDSIDPFTISHMYMAIDTEATSYRECGKSGKSRFDPATQSVAYRVVRVMQTVEEVQRSGLPTQAVSAPAKERTQNTYLFGCYRLSGHPPFVPPAG